MSLVSNRYLAEHVGIKENHERKSKYSQLSISVESASADSTKCGSKIFRGKKNLESSKKAKLEFIVEAIIYIAFILYLQLFA